MWGLQRLHFHHFCRAGACLALDFSSLTLLGIPNWARALGRRITGQELWGEYRKIRGKGYPRKLLRRGFCNDGKTPGCQIERGEGRLSAAVSVRNSFIYCTISFDISFGNLMWK
jgi:hypothetical protein